MIPRNTALRHVIQVEDCNLRVARGGEMGCEAGGRGKQQLQSRSQKLRVHSLGRTQTIALIPWYILQKGPVKPLGLQTVL